MNSLSKDWMYSTEKNRNPSSYYNWKSVSFLKLRKNSETCWNRKFPFKSNQVSNLKINTVKCASLKKRQWQKLWEQSTFRVWHAKYDYWCIDEENNCTNKVEGKPLKTFYLCCIIDNKSYLVPFAFSTACLKMHMMWSSDRK